MNIKRRPDNRTRCFDRIIDHGVEIRCTRVWAEIPILGLSLFGHFGDHNFDRMEKPWCRAAIIIDSDERNCGLELGHAQHPHRNGDVEWGDDGFVEIGAPKRPPPPPPPPDRFRPQRR